MIDTRDEVQQANQLGELLIDMYQPSSVVDMGCNTGLYLEPFLAKGCLVQGFDIEQCSGACVPITKQDLTEPFNPGRYSLAVCLETLEHIPEDKSEMVLTNLCCSSNKIIFSAAQPGAGGEGHVNLQPKEYWKKRFEARGFEYCPTESQFIWSRMRGKPGVMGWLLNNLMVFRLKVEYPYVFLHPSFQDDVTAVVSSCGRFDLLKRTLDSFNLTNTYPCRVIIADDSEDRYQHDLILEHYNHQYDVIINGANKGQAKNLDALYAMARSKYLFHMEDDWEFVAPGYIEMSMSILSDASIGKVQLDLRPEYFQCNAVGNDAGKYFEYNRWRIDDKHVWWNGWCGSPNLMRVKDLRKMARFSSVENEQKFDEEVYAKSGLRTVWAKRPYVRHIGYGRSTFGGSRRWIK